MMKSDIIEFRTHILPDIIVAAHLGIARPIRNIDGILIGDEDWMAATERQASYERRKNRAGDECIGHAVMDREYSQVHSQPCKPVERSSILPRPGSVRNASDLSFDCRRNRNRAWQPDREAQ
jgi:hypothetical protein